MTPSRGCSAACGEGARRAESKQKTEHSSATSKLSSAGSDGERRLSSASVEKYLQALNAAIQTVQLPPLRRPSSPAAPPPRQPAAPRQRPLLLLLLPPPALLRLR